MYAYKLRLHAYFITVHLLAEAYLDLSFMVSNKIAPYVHEWQHKTWTHKLRYTYVNIEIHKLMLSFMGCTNSVCEHTVIHENSVGLSSTTNPKPKGQPSISLPAQANLTQQIKAEPLRCLALRTRGGRLKSSFVLCPMGTLPTHRSGSYGHGQHAHMNIITYSGKLTESPVSTITSYYISL